MVGYIESTNINELLDEIKKDYMLYLTDNTPPNPRWDEKEHGQRLQYSYDKLVEIKDFEIFKHGLSLMFFGITEDFFENENIFEQQLVIESENHYIAILFYNMGIPYYESTFEFSFTNKEKEAIKKADEIDWETVKKTLIECQQIVLDSCGRVTT